VGLLIGIQFFAFASDRPTHAHPAFAALANSTFTCRSAGADSAGRTAFARGSASAGSTAFTGRAAFARSTALTGRATLSGCTRFAGRAAFARSAALTGRACAAFATLVFAVITAVDAQNQANEKNPQWSKHGLTPETQ
jgi:hypothetical protein